LYRAQVGTIASYYQAGCDPACERLSFGFVLLAHSVRSPMEEGATEYRFGRGAEPFKFRFTSEDPGLETVVLTHGAAGRAALWAFVIARAGTQARRAALRRIR